MPYITLGSLRFFYDTFGGERRAPAEPAIVLLHGLGSSGDDWPMQVGAFGARHRVVTFDARGHGRSDRPASAYSIGHMAGDVAELLGRLDEPPAHLIGLSLGGCIALQLALDYPGRVRSLVLVNSFARLQAAGLRGGLRFARRLWLLAVAPMAASAETIARRLFPKPDQYALYAAAADRLAANPKLTYWRAIRALAAFNAAARLGDVRCPALIVAGDRDSTVPLAAKQRLARGIRGARLVVVPESGHATPYDQAEMFNRIVLEFISGRCSGERISDGRARALPYG